MFNEDDGPQLPKNLTTAIEINGVMQSLIKKGTPLTLSFAGRSQRYLSYIIAADREAARFAMDELVPEEANALLQRGEPFHVEAYVDGVRVNWQNDLSASLSSLDDNPCYWFGFPAQLRYHQRRNAFRADSLPEQPVQLLLAGNLPEGRLVDLSATGCKVRYEGTETGLEAGQFHENARMMLPDGPIELTAEIRHLHIPEDGKHSFAGIKFHNSSGNTQRAIERYVYHLQREARRHSSDDFF